eukprot:XP_011663129.1 PREDICTED: uncharacterized protein LOC105437798 [Strongylocentrotus purpuratus]
MLFQTMDKYVIVEFLDTKEVEVVSSKWLGTNDGRQSCRWPPCDAASAKNAVMRHDPPEDTWPWFTCEVQEGGSTASYDKARKKLSKAENCLPLATTDDEHVGRRRVGRPGRFRESSDDEPELVAKRAKKLTSPRPSPLPFQDTLAPGRLRIQRPQLPAHLLQRRLQLPAHLVQTRLQRVTRLILLLHR